MDAFFFSGSASRLATVISALMDGVLILSRIMLDEEFNEIIDYVWELVGTEIQ
jgi:hypothetical protein